CGVRLYKRATDAQVLANAEVSIAVSNDRYYSTNPRSGLLFLGVREFLGLPRQLWQLSNVCRDPPGLVAGERLCCGSRIGPSRRNTFRLPRQTTAAGSGAARPTLKYPSCSTAPRPGRMYAGRGSY